MWRRYAALLLIFLATQSHAQNVYKCTNKDGTIAFQSNPCHDGDEPIAIRDNSFGGNKHAAEITIQSDSCITEYGYTKANGFIANNTKSPHAVELTTTFMKDGAAVDTVSMPYTINAFSREPFSMQGGRYFADSCHYHLAWH